MIPLDVPLVLHQEFTKNYHALTKGTDRLLLFAADHKIEHLDQDFFGTSLDPSIHNPEHLFAIAEQSRIGALATQFGLINRYAGSHKNINYVVKLNSKTNVIPRESKDPFSKELWNVAQVMTIKNQTQLPICGIGLTVYIGSEYESIMLEQAAQAVFEAHQQGLVAILWMYPRGKYVIHEKSSDILAGAAGVAATLGADFAKINAPHATEKQTSAELLKRAVDAAGNTKIICAGGETVDQSELLKRIYEQLTIGGTAGVGIGRNIYQYTLPEALALTEQLAKLIYDKMPLSA